jgi:hypothetical protein
MIFYYKYKLDMAKNLGHNSNVCILKFLKEWIDERINGEDIDCFNYNEFSNIEKIDKKIHETLKKANWENQNITVVLKNLNNSQITESDFKEFVTQV